MTKNSRFIQHAIDIANDDSHGYSQIRRWGLDFDCSSLMYECGYYAGYDLPKEGTRYTGTMIEHFGKCGYRVDAFDGNLNDLEPGDILLNTKYHTAVYIGNGKIVEASCSETGGIDGATGDQTGNEIHIATVYDYPWTHVLTPPKEDVNTSSPVNKESVTSNITVAQAVDRLAIACIHGLFGNGEDRKNRLYERVQKRVNEINKG